MTTPRLIFSEIDNTLVGPNYSLSDETISAIRKQIIHGNLFVPVSNRMPKAMMSVVSKITTASPLIAYDGALVLDEMGQPLNSQFMDIATAQKICTAVEKHPNLIWNIYSGYNWLTKDTENFYVQKQVTLTNVKPFPTTIEHFNELKGVHKISIMGKKHELAQLSKEIMPSNDLTISFFNDHTLDILAPNVSRAKGVKIMADFFAISLKDCISFGSLKQDQDMLAEIGNSYVTNLAPTILKNQFQTIPQKDNQPNFAQILANFA